MVDGAHGQHQDRNPPTPARHLRLILVITAVIAALLVASALVLLTIGAITGGVHTWTLGLTLLACAFITTAALPCPYLAGDIIRRITALEAGERHIAEAIDDLGEDGDELGRRRTG